MWCKRKYDTDYIQYSCNCIEKRFVLNSMFFVFFSLCCELFTPKSLKPSKSVWYFKTKHWFHCFFAAPLDVQRSTDTKSHLESTMELKGVTGLYLVATESGFSVSIWGHNFKSCVKAVEIRWLADTHPAFPFRKVNCNLFVVPQIYQCWQSRERKCLFHFRWASIHNGQPSRENGMIDFPPPEWGRMNERT